LTNRQRRNASTSGGSGARPRAAFLTASCVQHSGADRVRSTSSHGSLNGRGPYPAGPVQNSVTDAYAVGFMITVRAASSPTQLCPSTCTGSSSRWSGRARLGSTVSMA